MKLLNGVFAFLLVLFLIIGSACAQDNLSTSMNDTIMSSPELPSMIVSASVASGDMTNE
jgi:hypothetical protein